ncbi:MAG: histidinol-phosphatase [Gammaproteobacteria bacterium]|jgi:histidinol-phosphatase
MSYQEFLDVALQASAAAEKVVRYYYDRNVEVEIKEDRTPVTIADVETEKAIKKIILGAFPEHGFYGEETGKTNADADYLWLIDPIDGTKSFVRQYPFFSTQIALMHKGELVVGVSNGMMFNELAWAAKGQGAFMNGKPIQVSNIPDLDLSTLSMGNIATIAGTEQWNNLGALVQSVHRVRGYGDFYHYHLLASGKAEVIVESDLNILDIAALTVIMREAGAIVTELDGGDINIDTTTLLATTPLVRSTVESILG